MVDERVKKVAKILVEHSTKVKKGDSVLINGSFLAKDLLFEVYKLVLLKGAYPRVNIGLPGSGTFYYKNASETQLKHYPKIADYEMRNSDVVISIYGEDNTREFSSIDPKRISFRRRVIKPIHDMVMKKRWVIFDYPVNALAQEGDMSLEEFEDFVYSACILDWKKEGRKQDKLKRLMDKTDKVHIVGPGTDLKFSIKGRKAIKCDGKYNMPDGEVFIAPVDKSVNGYISYDFPAIYSGREVDGIRLEFKNGAVVKATAKKNESFLKQMVATDKGSKYLGEFGVGVNYGINRFIKNILFDEKIGGTIHLALGMAYKEGGGKNESAIHWDMIKDLRKDGALYFDGKLIQKNGKFTFKL